MFRFLFRTSNDLTLTIQRLVLGVVFFIHGAQKAFGWFGGHGFNATVDYFTKSMGIPYALAVLVIAAEFLGGIGLVVGFFGRLAALGIGCTMVGAIVKVHFAHGFFMNWANAPQQGQGYEYHLLAIAIALAILFRGSGALSMDRKLGQPSVPVPQG